MSMIDVSVASHVEEMMCTQREDGLPSKKLRYHGIDVRQVGTVREFGKAILADDCIELRLGFVLHIRMVGHR